MGRTPSDKTSLRRVMTAKGLTSGKLAELTGIPETTISNVAFGGAKFSQERFEIVCRALNCVEADLADVKGGRRGRKPNQDHPWKTAKSATAAAEKPKPGHNPIQDSEKLWLYVHQGQRRQNTSDTRIKALEEQVAMLEARLRKAGL